MWMLEGLGVGVGQLPKVGLESNLFSAVRVSMHVSQCPYQLDDFDFENQRALGDC